MALPLGELSPQVTERAHAVGFVAEVLGVIRKLPAVLLPLPLGEVASRSDDGEGELVLHHDMRLRGAIGAQQLRQPDAGV